MFGCCLSSDQHHKFFKRKQAQAPKFDVNLSIKENHLIFTFSGTSTEVHKRFRESLQTVKLDYYQADPITNSNHQQEKQSGYHLAIKLSNAAAIRNMFYYLQRINKDPYNALKSLPSSERAVVENIYYKTKQIMVPPSLTLEISERKFTPGR